MIDVERDLWSYLAKSKKPIVMYGTGDGADKIIAELEKYGAGSTDYYTLGVHKNATDGDFGAKYEKYKCCGEGDMTPFWNACGVDGVFIGHCHMNNSSILYNGVRLTFGLKTGAYDYYTNGQLGGTVIQCEESGAFEVRHITTLVPYDPPFPM